MPAPPTAATLDLEIYQIHLRFFRGKRKTFFLTNLICSLKIEKQPLVWILIDACKFGLVTYN
jgi:hypothetical protein